MVTVIGYASTRFGTTLAFFATAKMAAFAASNSWPPPSQFLLYVTVNFISDVVVVTFLPPKAEDDDADDPPRNRKEASRAGKDDDKDKPFDDDDDDDDDDRMAALRMYRVNTKRVQKVVSCLVVSDVYHFRNLLFSFSFFLFLHKTLNVRLEKKIRRKF